MHHFEQILGFCSAFVIVSISVSGIVRGKRERLVTPFYGDSVLYILKST